MPPASARSHSTGGKILVQEYILYCEEAQSNSPGKGRAFFSDLFRCGGNADDCRLPLTGQSRAHLLPLTSSYFINQTAKPPHGPATAGRNSERQKRGSAWSVLDF